MARRVITIDEKIEKQTAEVTKVKKKYDEELDKLNTLIEKKKEMERKELLEAFSKKWISSTPNRPKQPPIIANQRL